jgi:hypothetical protein
MAGAPGSTVLGRALTAAAFAESAAAAESLAPGFSPQAKALRANATTPEQLNPRTTDRRFTLASVLDCVVTLGLRGRCILEIVARTRQMRP